MAFHFPTTTAAYTLNAGNACGTSSIVSTVSVIPLPVALLAAAILSFRQPIPLTASGATSYTGYREVMLEQLILYRPAVQLPIRWWVWLEVVCYSLYTLTTNPHIHGKMRFASNSQVCAGDAESLPPAVAFNHMDWQPLRHLRLPLVLHINRLLFRGRQQFVWMPCRVDCCYYKPQPNHYHCLWCQHGVCGRSGDHQRQRCHHYLECRRKYVVYQCQSALPFCLHGYRFFQTTVRLHKPWMWMCLFRCDHHRTNADPKWQTANCLASGSQQLHRATTSPLPVLTLRLVTTCIR